MDADALLGSWIAESGGSALTFDADGTYSRVTSVDLGTTFAYGNISIDEVGTYVVGDATLTFTPTGGHYRRDGVDEGLDMSVRVMSARLAPNADQSATDLVLDDGIWTKDEPGGSA
jgi:hypothetical protein